MPAYVLVMRVLALPIAGLSADVATLSHTVNALTMALLTLRVCWLAARGGSLELPA